MKQFLTAAFAVFLTLNGRSQSDSLYISGCEKTRVHTISNNRMRMYAVDTCANTSFIADKLSGTRHYIEDGLFIEYWDNNFQNIERVGFYSENHPTGLWQEYYKNGKLRYEGLCKLFSFFLKRAKTGYTDTLKIVDETMPADTARLAFTNRAFDSIRGLQQYYEHDENLPHSKSFGFPSTLGLKSGRWLYYDERGTLLKTDYYLHGTLIKSEKAPVNQ